MKKRVFVSDFDGTITQRDFFRIYMDLFLGERGVRYLNEYRAENNPSYQFLNNVFAMQKIKEEEYWQILREIRWDENFKNFLSYLNENQMDHIILSAGVDFYIRDALALFGYPQQRIIANSGSFEEGLIRLRHDERSPFFSPQYGIDKGSVIRYLRQEYDRIYFAGDAIPDLSAAREADHVFAKSHLAHYYRERGDERVMIVENYGQITEKLAALLGEQRV